MAGAVSVADAEERGSRTVGLDEALESAELPLLDPELERGPLAFDEAPIDFPLCFLTNALPLVYWLTSKTFLFET